MAITLLSLPNEILLHICQSFADPSDLSNFRLACRLLGEISLPALGDRVTFAFMPESINRLREISSHPIFRRHVKSVVCLMNVFYPHLNSAAWKLVMSQGLTSGYDASLIAGFSEHDWADSNRLYNMLIDAQNEAFMTIGTPQDIQAACRGFLNLESLHIRDARDFHPDHFCRNPAFKFLKQRHGSLANCSSLPAYSYNIFPQEIALPGVCLLSSLLGAFGESQLTSLQVDALDLQVFDQDDGVYAQMMENVRNLRTLRLCIWDACEDAERRMADRVLAEGRLKTYLSSAPDLEDLYIGINGAFFGTGLYYATSPCILPTGHMWPHLRTLRFLQVELLAPDFLEFLSFHGHALKSFELTTCAIAGPPNQEPPARRWCWSDIVIPLTTTYSLRSLSLSGWLIPAAIQQEPGQETRIAPAMDMDHDTVLDVSISVREAIGLVASSKEFESCLHGEVGRRNDLDLNVDGDTIKSLADEIKEGIIRDLLDRAPITTSEAASEVIPTRYGDYLKLFKEGILDEGTD